MAQRRRGHGEGSIHQRPDGRWCATLDLGLIDGKRKRKYLYGDTRRDVVEQLKSAQRAQASGVNLAMERITIAQFLDRWLQEIVSRRNKIRTIDGYTQIVNQHLKPHLGQYQIDKLLPEHVQTMLNRLSEDGRKYNTVRNVRAVLRRALNQAMRWQYVQRNVATLVDVPHHRAIDESAERTESDPEFHIQPLDEQQARALLRAVTGHRWEALYRVALSLGLRLGEILGLRWSDISFDQATLRVSGSLQRLRGKLERTSTKTRGSMRPIDLPPILLAALRQHRHAQEQEQRIGGESWQTTGFVFTTGNGTPIDPRNLTRHFKQVLRTAGIPTTVRFHDLRHSCATLLIAQDVHPRVVMEILRHTQISTTMNTYAHVLPRLQRDATAKVEQLLCEPTAAEAANEERQPEDQHHPAQDVSTISPKKTASDSSG
ncbi:MAG: tyrosine-type recombinase/integrase [Roseiflexaceae bacterium]|nr:tyrosine-type recombinase/integrase [Roseiflexaceae bacterium]